LGDLLVKHDRQQRLSVIYDQVDHDHRQTVYRYFAGHLVVVACDRKYVFEYGLQHGGPKYFGPGSINEQLENFDCILIQAYFARIPSY